MVIWLVYGTTESGDDWQLGFRNEPTDDQIHLAIENDDWLREEYEAECIQGWHVIELYLEDN